jgi:hypothetical protein
VLGSETSLLLGKPPAEFRQPSGSSRASSNYSSAISTKLR